ncbi:hypothetical protein C7974DRAFT_160745 [Boeremia exigua]|uniref:uncharacterized protein n=1 Tax=Boeremia exigua TaxID=749465 RepID=UPI001E8CE909|nr:uncharacterized protein C7974DRAFT_160745 [Boeremia exigua]KAH6638443.1 hypothetical protein C7974DRAFT_160745 [Boeremia exigua]
MACWFAALLPCAPSVATGARNGPPPDAAILIPLPGFSGRVHTPVVDGGWPAFGEGNRAQPDIIIDAPHRDGGLDVEEDRSCVRCVVAKRAEVKSGVKGRRWVQPHPRLLLPTVPQRFCLDGSCRRAKIPAAISHQ